MNMNTDPDSGMELLLGVHVIDTAESLADDRDNCFAGVITKVISPKLWVKRDLPGLQIWRMRESWCHCLGDEPDSLFLIAN